MTALLSLDLTPAINAFDVRIAEAWRIASQEVGEAIRFVKQYRRVIDERDEMLTPTVRVHRPASVERCEKLLPWALPSTSDTSARFPKPKPKWKRAAWRSRGLPMHGENDQCPTCPQSRVASF